MRKSITERWQAIVDGATFRRLARTTRKATTSPRDRTYPRFRGYLRQCSFRCQICDSPVSGPLQTANYVHRNWWLCRECFTDRDIRRVLDLLCWSRHPEQIPSCMNCRQTLQPQSARTHECIDWYFCPACYTNAAVRLKWTRICEDMSR